MGNASRLKTWRSCSPCLLVCSAPSDWLSKKSLKLTMGENSVSIQSSRSACLIRNARGIGGEPSCHLWKLNPLNTAPAINRSLRRSPENQFSVILNTQAGWGLRSAGRTGSSMARPDFVALNFTPGGEPRRATDFAAVRAFMTRLWAHQCGRVGEKLLSFAGENASIEAFAPQGVSV